MGTKLQQLVTALLVCLSVYAGLVLATPVKQQRTAHVNLDSSTLRVVRKANERLLSFTLDSSYIMERWVDKHMRDEKFLKLTSHLAPAYLRVGGTDSDAMLFKESSSLEEKQHRKDAPRDIQTFYMTSEEWKLINEFAVKAGVKLVFCINALHRSGSAWDQSNAKELLEYSNKQGYNVSFQLGNEPDLFSALYHKYVAVGQLAADFAKLRTLLDSFPRYKSSLLIGPDVFSSDSYLSGFLEAQKNTLSVVSAHHYYVAGDVAKLQEFYNATILNTLTAYINKMLTVLSKTNTKAPFWLSETSSAYKGGATNITDRFVDGFMWLDKLGLAAKLGVDVVCRQDLYGNKYSLLDVDNLDPNPDWWLSVLYKKLVDVGVLSVATPTGTVRMYGHCSKTSPGSMVLFGMNLNAEEAEIRINSTVAGVKASKISAYVLTGETGLLSKTVLLNGKRLTLGTNYSLPKFEPKSVTSPVELPAHSLAFFVLEDAKIPTCK